MKVRLWPWYRRRFCPWCGAWTLARLNRRVYEGHLKVHARQVVLGLVAARSWDRHQHR